LAAATATAADHPPAALQRHATLAMTVVWWRAGYGSLPTTSGYPASANFTGAIDEFALYQTELTAARVAAHYAAR